VLLPSSAGVLSLRPRRNGDDSSGWNVDEVYVEPYIVQNPAALVRVRDFAARRHHEVRPHTHLVWSAELEQRMQRANGGRRIVLVAVHPSIKKWV